MGKVRIRFNPKIENFLNSYLEFLTWPDRSHPEQQNITMCHYFHFKQYRRCNLSLFHSERTHGGCGLWIWGVMSENPRVETNFKIQRNISWSELFRSIAKSFVVTGQSHRIALSPQLIKSSSHQAIKSSSQSHQVTKSSSQVIKSSSLEEVLEKFGRSLEEAWKKFGRSLETLPNFSQTSSKVQTSQITSIFFSKVLPNFSPTFSKLLLDWISFP